MLTSNNTTFGNESIQQLQALKKSLAKISHELDVELVNKEMGEFTARVISKKSARVPIDGSPKTRRSGVHNERKRLVEKFKEHQQI